MSEGFNLEIVNPEKSFLSKENVSEVVVPAFEGEMGILKDHISIISFLKPGIIKVFIGSEEDKLVVSRARKIQRFLSQPFFVAEVFTGSPGKLVDLESTIKGFDAICKGEYDHLPEAAFYMVGTIEEVIQKAEKMAKDAAA